MTTNVTVSVIGGGIAGLVAATEVAEAGVPVRLMEARGRLGGRAQSHPEPWVTNLGPHALYAGTGLWRWLRARGMHRPASMPHNPNLYFRWNGRASRVPPRSLAAALARLGADQAPVELDLRTWATQRWDDDTARALAGLAGSLTFDHDPGRISAAFVAPRIRDIICHQPTRARYVPGGWGAMIERMVTRAQAVGVDLQADAKVESSSLDDLRGQGPVILAVGPGAARRMLGSEVAPDDQRRVGLLDVGLVRRRHDPYLIWDLDQAAFYSRGSAIVRGLAPDGHDLIQLSVGMWPGEELEEVEARLEAVLDSAVDDWRERTVWRRRGAVRSAAGAVDLPGFTWCDRPSVSQGDGLWIAGDWVAAPGHLAEVSVNSATQAAAAAVAAVTALSGASALSASPSPVAVVGGG